MEHRVSVENLYNELRRYVELRLQRLKIVAVEKCVYLLAVVAFAMIAALFVVIAICYFSFSFVHLLQIYVGAIAAYALVAIILLCMVLLLYWQRRRWILDPIARMMIRILIDDEELK